MMNVGSKDSGRLCAVCHQPSVNLTDMKVANIYSASGSEFELLLCKSHYFHLFLRGQFRFLIDYHEKIIHWMATQRRDSDIDAVMEIVNRGESWIRKQSLDNVS